MNGLQAAHRAYDRQVPADTRTDEEIEIDALKSVLVRRNEKICELQLVIEHYNWLMDCARKTGIVVTFKGDVMSIVHGTTIEAGAA